MEDLILIDNLTKRYGNSPVCALDSLNLKVKAGECYGYLGSNGAGKSTTIRLLLNFIQPTSGSAQIMGNDVVKQTVKARSSVGYLSGDVALFSKPTGKELLDYLCSLQGLKDLTYRRELEKRFEADLSKPTSTLSKGNRQKLGIIQAFMHKPDVLILDEPTSGLDPLMQEAFYTTVEENKKRGAAIFMSSHNLAEAQRVCDRIGIIKKGKLIHEQDLGEDTELTTPTFHIKLSKPASEKLLKDPAIKVIKKLSGTSLLVQPAKDIASALKAISHYEIEEFSSEKPDLEDEFLEFYGGTE